ncbi:MAG: hypothetical protein JSS10_08320 [Verrucomicrobia bacterium]|nr:hypothetical protein [Verrucomicrobiota bacterium]
MHLVFALFFLSQVLGNDLPCNLLNLREIPAEVPFHCAWEMTPPANLSALLSQSFTYLGEGHQCLAFVSEDQQYVLKFPLLRPHPSPWWHKLPFYARKHQHLHAHRIYKKLKKDSVRYFLALDTLKAETGLVYVHLNRTSILNTKVQITDKEGLQHIIDLDQVEFLLQKKAQLVYPALQAWMNQGQIHQAKEGLFNLVQLLYKRLEKGVDDPEQNLEGNFGFIGTEAIQIDLGHLRKKKQPTNPVIEKKKIENLLAPLKQQLAADYPQLSQYLEQILL